MSAAALQEVQGAPLALIGSARAGRRTLLDMLLSVKGYEIAVCEDGPAVLEFLKENQPAIAIFDHDLPGMDGREICSRMRFITRLAEIPIAIVTPPVEEMGGLNEFEDFTDTTTADIVEAEPLGKKKLVERLENVIRDQKGTANDGKMTIAIPTMAVSEYKGPELVDKGNDLDVFVDDDVDIEVDVARAIYSNGASFEQQTEQEPVADSADASSSVIVQAFEVTSEAELLADEAEMAASPAEIESVASAAENVASAAENDVAEAGYPMEGGQIDALSDEPAADYRDDIFLSDQVDAPGEEVNDAGDFDLFTDEGETEQASTSEAEVDWPETLVVDGAHEAEPVDTGSTAGALDLVDLPSDAGSGIEVSVEELGLKDTLVELVTDSIDKSFSRPGPASSLPELVEQPVEEPWAGTLNAVPEDDGQSAKEPWAETFNSVPEEDGQSVDEANGEYLEVSGIPSGAEESASYVRTDSATEREQSVRAEDASAADYTEDADDTEEDDLTATIEAAIEAMNLAAMEEAEFRAAQAAAQEKLDVENEAESEFDQPSDGVEQPAPVAAPDVVEIDVKATVEMVVENAQLQGADDSERLETIDARAHDYADGSDENRIESPSAEADGLEEGDPAVSSGEQYNMQALIAEQADRIDNLQERNVMLRQELEQLKADDALRHEERSNLQALIKEQTEAITNLQQRNVQLRQELEQFRAEEAKRESERTFLQSHTSEQAETIAKLQQLNALLRQELEQRKADEAPLRDFLQRLLDRDEESSAYQEAMRKEIISLTRENS